MRFSTLSIFILVTSFTYSQGLNKITAEIESLILSKIELKDNYENTELKVTVDNLQCTGKSKCSLFYLKKFKRSFLIEHNKSGRYTFVSEVDKYSEINGLYFYFEKINDTWIPLERGQKKNGNKFGEVQYFRIMDGTPYLNSLCHYKLDKYYIKYLRVNGETHSKGSMVKISNYGYVKSGKWLFYDNNSVISEKGKYKGEQIEWNHKQGIYIINGLDTISFSDLNLKDYGFDAPEFKHYDLKVGLWKYYKDGKLYRKEKYDKTGKIIYRRDL